jgi:hypothetical protein
METGASLLDGTSQLLSTLLKGRVPTNFADLPGIGVWIEQNGTLEEERIMSARDLVETAFRERPILTEDQSRLIEAYRIAVTEWNAVTSRYPKFRRWAEKVRASLRKFVTTG